MWEDDSMAAEPVRQSHTARLSFWNRLFHGIPVALEELDPEVLCVDKTSSNECASYVVLRACTAISHSGRRAVRAAFRVAILYWFSNLGEAREGARELLQPQSTAFHLGEAIGTSLSWDEAVALLGRKPVDFSAYVLLIENLGAEYARQWESAFPGTPPASIAVLAQPFRDNAYAQQWGPGREPSPRRGLCRAPRPQGETKAVHGPDEAR
jgi:hypothetical protein